MFATINTVKIHYHVSGQGKPVVLLHGWGAQLTSFAPVHAFLEKYFHTYALDLPGFGQSDLPDGPWGTAEYAAAVHQFMQQCEIKNPVLIGHSFGGRIAIRLAASRPVHKMILIDSAGIRPKRGPQYYLKVYTYKCLKRLMTLPGVKSHAERLVERFRKNVGSHDYQQASGIMRAVLVNVVNEDLRDLLPCIQAPTLLIWGEHDDDVPVSDAKRMEELIPDAGLVVLKNAAHFSYLDKPNEFLIIINSFLHEDMQRNNG